MQSCTFMNLRMCVATEVHNGLMSASTTHAEMQVYGTYACQRCRYVCYESEYIRRMLVSHYQHLYPHFRAAAWERSISNVEVARHFTCFMYKAQ